MYVERLDLDDFGCFERAGVDGLSDGLTVIAGPQRAGKTTFMRAVRRLGYGISRGDDLPPPADEYDLTATVVADGRRYRLEVRGYAEPRVVPIDGGPDLDPRELYGGLSAAHYRQLYTIGLDELRRVPRSLDDDASLSAILLGAAYGDVLDVPAVRDAFADEAHGIGGVRASARGVYRMKEPTAEIRRGIEERAAAVEQVDEHERIGRERREILDRIEAIDDERAALREERIRLDAVRSDHEDFRRLRRLDERLEAVDEEELDAFPTELVEEVEAMLGAHEDARRELEAATAEFEALVVTARGPGRADAAFEEGTVDRDDPPGYDSDADDRVEANGGAAVRTVRERSLEVRSSIREYAAERAGWRERVDALAERRRTLEGRRRELERKAGELHPGWDGDLDRVAAIDTDPVSSERVRSAVEAYRSAEAAVRDAAEDVSELERRLEALDDRVESAVASAGATGLLPHAPVVIGGALAGVLGGAAAGFAAGPIVGALVTALALLVAGGYVASKLGGAAPTHDGVSVETLRAERDKVAAELDARRATLEERRAARRAAESELRDVADALDLPPDAPAAAIRRFHDDLVDLQSALSTLEDDEESLAGRAAALRSELDAVVETLAYVGALEDRGRDPLADAPALIAAIDDALARVEAAEAVAEAARTVERVESELVEALAEWPECPPVGAGETDRIAEISRTFVDRGSELRAIREAVDERDELRARLGRRLSASAVERSLESFREPGDGEDWRVDAFERVLDERGGVGGVEERLEGIDTEREELERERSELVERRVELDRRLDELASDDDVRAAHATIERGRKRLEPLAERYATARIAEHLLSELHERFVARTTGPLLEDAGEIFARITDETYAAIDSEDEFDEVDFVARLRDGSTRRSGELSRATAEQLFLAVRLARIRQHDVPLPVLLDDSLTNFDPGHADRTLEAIVELAEDFQVFVLTCHPSLLDRIESRASADYWSLDAGRFDGPYATADRARALLRGDD